MAQETNEYREQRLASMKALREMGYEPYGRRYDHVDLRAARENFEEGKPVRVAGRLLMIRRMGKMNFCTMNDGTGRFQLIFKRDELSETAFAAFKQLNLGDIIGAEGVFFTTQKGEKSVVVKEWTMLAKALEQPPEKFHGLADQEERYRRRYVDLMTNDESRERFFVRSRLIMEIRKYLWDRGFVEVETPILQDQAGGAAAKPFFSHFNALDKDCVMRIAPELYLKRLLVGGPRVHGVRDLRGVRRPHLDGGDHGGASPPPLRQGDRYAQGRVRRGEGGHRFQSAVPPRRVQGPR